MAETALLILTILAISLREVYQVEANISETHRLQGILERFPDAEVIVAPTACAVMPVLDSRSQGLKHSLSL